MPSKPSFPSHYVHTLPGVEPIAKREVRLRLPDAAVLGTRILPRRNGLLLLRLGDYAEDDLVRLRTAEDVFAMVAYRDTVAWGRQGLQEAFQAVRQARIGSTLRRPRSGGRQRSGALRFRVIARVSGPEQPYGRHDLANAVAAALRERSKGHWRRVDSNEDVEIWANMVGRSFVCGVRLSDASMRHRDYQRVHMAASLRPSLAAAMVLLSDPQPSDVFLDPMCGAGTILIERALMGRHRLLLGGDIDREAISASAMNIGRKHKPRQLFEWDAGRLPLGFGSIDKLVCNLPFGRKVQVPGGLRRLYERFTAECARVVRPGGVAVLLTSESGLLLHALDTGRLYVERQYPVNVLGHGATIHCVRRSAAR